jgi:hypothetical protein
MRATARQQEQNDPKPERHSKQEAHELAPQPHSGFTAWIGNLAASFERPVGRRPRFFPIFETNEQPIFRKFDYLFSIGFELSSTAVWCATIVRIFEFLGLMH